MKDDDDVIDLTQYLKRDTQPRDGDIERASFSVFGGDGNRSRFALPIWRSIYLVGGRRGGLVWVSRGGAPDPNAEFVLDLGSDPARTDFTLPNAGAADSSEAPAIFEETDSVAVFLGMREKKNWFLVLDDYGPSGVVAGYDRRDLFFLAGECAGLLFFRELAEAGENLDGEQPGGP